MLQRNLSAAFYQLARRRRWSTVLVAVLLVPAVGAASPRDDVDPWIYAYAGFDHFYSLEYDQALVNFQQALARDLSNPIFVNYLAHTYLFREMHRTGRLDTDLYSESNAFLKEERPKPDPEVMETVKRLVEQSKELSQRRLKANPRDTTALYALGVAHAIEANYEFTIYRRGFAALRAGTRAKEYHEQLKRLDPNYYDADLILGLFEYAIGSIPASVRWLAVLAGYRGSRERGIQLLHSAMTRGRLVTTDAAVLLVVIYNREKQYGYMRSLLARLAEFYPRNYLIPLEIARTYLRESNERAALAEYLRVAEKVEAGAPGFERVDRLRLYYQIGSFQQRLNNYEQALVAYEKVTSASNADGLLRAFASVRKGEIFLARNEPQRARREAEHVVSLPYPEPRAQAERILHQLARQRP